jgi:hypothetical protein
VLALVAHKLLHLGVLPEDPRELPFDVRLMWQGPFATLEPLRGLALLGLGALPLAYGARLAWAARAGRSPEPAAALAGLLGVLGLAAAWLVERALVWPAPIAAALAAPLLARRPPGRARALSAGLLLALQAAWFGSFASSHRVAWYPPPVVRAELAAALEKVRELVPEGEAVAADFVVSPALLAGAGRRIAFQPKWESERSRARARDLVEGFYRASPDELRRMLLERYRCRYVLVDRATLGYGARYAAGLRAGEPPPRGSAAAALLSRDREAPASIPGWRLLYRSPPAFLQRDGSPSDQFRLYRLDP